MTAEIAYTLFILIVTIALFVWDRLGVDLVAMICLLALTLPGILTPSEALAGFSSSAVITIAAIFVVSSALLRTGAADRMGDLFLKLGAGNPLRLLIVIMLGVSFISAFMYNAPATAVLMPAVIVTARRAQLAPSRLLIPLSYGAVLGGTMTLIGATPNLVISQALESHGLAQFHIFDPLVMGLIFTLSGIIFMALAGRHLLPNRDAIQENGHDRSPEELVSLYCLAERWHRLRIGPGSRLVGQTLQQACLGCDYGIAVLGAFVFGVTEDDDPSLFERTVEWGIEAKLDLAQFSVNTPEPGARDFEYAVRNDLITDWNWEHYDAEHPVRKFAKITPQQMFEGHTNANRWFYTATSAWKRLKPSFKDLLNLRNGRRGTLVSAINAYLAGTARHYAARHNYAAFERSRITIPNPFVIQQFGPGMPENQFDAKTRARALLNNGHNPLRDVIPNVTFG